MASLTGGLLLAAFPPQDAWRYLFAIGGAPALTAIWAFFGCPNRLVTSCIGETEQYRRRCAFPVGTRVRLGRRNVVSLVFETGWPARIDDVADPSGEPATFAHEQEFGAVAGAPISVEGRLWGVVMVISTSEQPLPLVATALANAEAQAAHRLPCADRGPRRHHPPPHRARSA